MDTIIKAIVFLPLIGFLIAGLGGNTIGAKASEFVTCGFMVIACALSWLVFFQVGLGHEELIKVSVMRWIQSGSFDVEWAFRVDTLTAVMFVVVNTVSMLVHVYSIGYMHHDPHRPRFFAYLSLFTFAMLMLVTGDNLLQIFFGWEGVGLASYLLIGFWYKKASANAAAMKAFIVNRVGDFGFLLGMAAVFVLFGSVNLETIFATAATYLPKYLADQHRGLYQFLLNKWYFDELYDFLFVRPALRIGRLFWKGGDGAVIDGLGPNGLAARVLDVTDRVVRLQTGYLYHYAFAMLLGIAALVTWMMLGSSI